MTKTLSTEVAISGAPPPPGRRTPGEVCGEAGQADADEAHRSVVEPSRRLDRHHLVSAVPPRGGLSLGHVPRAHVQGPGPGRWPLRTCPGTRSPVTPPVPRREGWRGTRRRPPCRGRAAESTRGTGRGRG